MPAPAPLPDGALRADPLADATVAAIVAARPGAERIEALHEASALMATWHSNADLAHWQAPAGTTPGIAAALQHYLAQARALPDWADAGRIARAEALFMDNGPLSCVLLFCASLPECYVLPDLAAVLHMAGELEARTDHRIRATAAMIFPVMMRGGLTDGAGAGVAQALKVRLIHATIRHLVLRTDPATALAAVQASGEGRYVVPPQRPAHPTGAAPGLFAQLHAQGWDLGQDGLPCNQHEQAYTLLTFGYVFLRGMRTLGQRLSADDEAAYLHAWNVLGHLIGIEDALLPRDYAQAQAWFERMQAEGRADRHFAGGQDARPALAAALMQAMQAALPWPRLRAFPVLLTRWLCGAATARDLQLNTQVGWAAWALFAAALGLLRGLDALLHRLRPGLSLTRLLTRIVGYHWLTHWLLRQTRPLALPERVRAQMQALVLDWSDDARAPRWANRLEDRFTTQGLWRPHR